MTKKQSKKSNVFYINIDTLCKCTHDNAKSMRSYVRKHHATFKSNHKHDTIKNKTIARHDRVRIDIDKNTFTLYDNDLSTSFKKTFKNVDNKDAHDIVKFCDKHQLTMYATK